jgi:hypothetical protein
MKSPQREQSERRQGPRAPHRPAPHGTIALPALRRTAERPRLNDQQRREGKKGRRDGLREAHGARECEGQPAGDDEQQGAGGSE